jgi:pyruvate/2-oxoglutarate dehydrogenase complex dihydrolipoamide dehydrogenase (E3) component
VQGADSDLVKIWPQVYDLVLKAVGRTPNGKKIAADKAAAAFNAGVIPSVTDPEVAWVGSCTDVPPTRK